MYVLLNIWPVFHRKFSNSVIFCFFFALAFGQVFLFMQNPLQIGLWEHLVSDVIFGKME